MYIPRFHITQAEHDAASEEDKQRFNYLVVPDEPIPLPANFCCPHQERDNAENRSKSRPLNEK